MSTKTETKGDPASRSIDDIVRDSPFPKDGMFLRNDRRNHTERVNVNGDEFNCGQQCHHNAMWPHVLRVNLLRGWRLIT